MKFSGILKEFMSFILKNVKSTEELREGITDGEFILLDGKT